MTDDDYEIEPWAVGMHPKDAMFVREFLLDFNAMQADIRCGEKPEWAQKSAWRKLRKPTVAKGIAAAMQERSEALGINAKLILAEAFRCYLGALEDRNWNAAAKFLEMCGKHVDVQAFRTQVGLSDPNGEPLDFNLSGMTTDEKVAALAILERLTGEQLGEDYARNQSPPRLNS